MHVMGLGLSLFKSLEISKDCFGYQGVDVKSNQTYLLEPSSAL